jgi:hypothetical protein
LLLKGLAPGEAARLQPCFGASWARIKDPLDHPTAFTTKRDRLLAGAVAAKFLAAVLIHARVRQFLYREHFTDDGTPLEEAFGARMTGDEPPGGGCNASRDFTASGAATTPRAFDRPSRNGRRLSQIRPAKSLSSSAILLDLVFAIGWPV